MIKIKVFKVDSNCSSNPNYENEALAPMEDFIARIGYDSIRNIIVSAPGSPCSFYTIFYEDGQHYSPRTETAEPKKKGIFG